MATAQKGAPAHTRSHTHTHTGKKRAPPVCVGVMDAGQADGGSVPSCRCARPATRRAFIARRTDVHCARQITLRPNGPDARNNSHANYAPVLGLLRTRPPACRRSASGRARPTDRTMCRRSHSRSQSFISARARSERGPSVERRAVASRAKTAGGRTRQIGEGRVDKSRAGPGRIKRQSIRIVSHRLYLAAGARSPAGTRVARRAAVRAPIESQCESMRALLNIISGPFGRARSPRNLPLDTQRAGRVGRTSPGFIRLRLVERLGAVSSRGKRAFRRP